MDFIKSAFADETKFSIEQKEFTDEAKSFHGSRAYTYFETYLLERERKLTYLLENVSDEEFNQDQFLEFLAKEKGNICPVNYF